MGFAAVEVIDEYLGRSGSELVERPGFQRLVAAVCGGAVGGVFCIEASGLPRKARDWHHLIDLCALVGTLVIDPDGVYEPRLINNDRLLLGLRGTCPNRAEPTASAEPGGTGCEGQAGRAALPSSRSGGLPSRSRTSA